MPTFVQHALKPRSPHLNGKVERGHKTDLQEFYATQYIDDPELERWLDEWQMFYNWYRPHSSLGGKTPSEKCHELSEQTPFWDEVEAQFDPGEETIREQHYPTDLAIRKVK